MTDQEKKLVAESALKYIKEDLIVGIGTGSTVDYMIQAMKEHSIEPACVVSSSSRTQKALERQGINCVDANQVSHIDVYIDGADVVDHHFYAIKGAGGAMTQEKLLSHMARTFVVMIEQHKYISQLDHRVPVPVEVMGAARSWVSRQLCLWEASPVYREGALTDQGHSILDVYELNLSEPSAMEHRINQLPGVVDNGLFTHRLIDVLLIGSEDAVTTKQRQPEDR